jgi:DNA-binding NarL/FixJ family response regulator
MPNTDLNRKRARRAVGVFGADGGMLKTATAERLVGTLSAFQSGSRWVSLRSRSQRPNSPARFCKQHEAGAGGCGWPSDARLSRHFSIVKP